MAKEFRINIHGPRHTRNFVASLRYFIYRTEMKMRIHEHIAVHPVTFSDKNVSVTAVELTLPSEPKFQSIVSTTSRDPDDPKKAYFQDDVDASPHNLVSEAILGKALDAAGVSDCNADNVHMLKHAKLLPTPSAPSSAVCCFILRVNDLPGKFDIQKAKKLNVPPGPSYSKLVRGEDVVLADGTIIHPSDCVGPPQKIGCVIVSYCPDIAYVESLVTNKAWTEYYSGGTELVRVVFHITPAPVLAMKEHQNWLQRFSKNTQHVFVNDVHCPKETVFRAAGQQQMKLHLLHDNIFPLAPVQPVKNGNLSVLQPNCLIAKSLLKYILRQTKPAQRKRKRSSKCASDWDTSMCFAQLSLTDIGAELQRDQAKCWAAFQSFQHTRKEYETQQTKENEEEESVEVIFLGTGAAMPGRYRNVSGTFLTVGSKGCFLDCGEGTLGQMNRMFGGEKTTEYLRNLQCITVSHMHADHHLGLVRILQARDAAILPQQEPDSNKPLLVIGPRNLQAWLEEITTITPLSYTFVPCHAAETSAVTAGIFNTIKTVQVEHCVDAYGMIYTLLGGSFKVVFSGDTRPCAALVEAGKDCNILIHEATFEDELHEEALNKNHSTTSEAVGCGEQMHAGFVLLNHFSQRYPKIPDFSGCNKAYAQRIGVAFDMMRVSTKNLAILPKLLPGLQSLYEEAS
eukprot:TRINITY_DN10509_c0_g1_i1.p1 TRINITY_DN10509_c0_g1~~TRINITY_DN10509_c0_g1_i1.p1  ORF type:complete len:701 (-),score=80.05 TRINITY_DN10509_c0_g1_i1:977-3019(-)